MAKNTSDYALMSKEAVPNLLSFKGGSDIMIDYISLTVIIEIQVLE
jgi:hypothetical protein